MDNAKKKLNLVTKNAVSKLGKIEMIFFIFFFYLEFNFRFEAVFVQAIQEDDTEITFIDSDINESSIYNNEFDNIGINKANENKNRNSSLFEMINNKFVTELSQKPTEIYDNSSKSQTISQEYNESQGIALNDLFGVENLKHFDRVQNENDKQWVSQSKYFLL